MVLRRKHALLIFLGVSCAMLLAVFLAREFLLESILKAYVDRTGDEIVQLEVVHVGLNQTTIVNLKSKGIRVGRVTARYALSDLLKGRVALIEVDGLALALDLTSPGTGRDFRLPSIPPVALSEAVISAETPLGPVSISAEGWTEPTDQEGLQANLDIRGSSRFGVFDGRLSGVVAAEGLQSLDLGLRAPSSEFDGIELGQTVIDLELKDERWSAHASTQTADGGAEVVLRGGATGTKGLRNIAIEVVAGMSRNAASLRELVSVPIDAEEIRSALSITAAGPLPDALPSTSGDWVTALARTRLSGSIEIEILDLQLPTSGHLVSAGLRVSATSDANGLILALPESVPVSAKTVDDPLLGAPEAAFDWPQLIAEDAVLHFRGLEKAASPELSLRATADDGVALAYAGAVTLSVPQDRRVWLAADGEVLFAPDLGKVRFQSKDSDLGLQGIKIPGLEVDIARFKGSISGDGERLTARGTFDMATPEFRLGDLRFREASFSAPIDALIEGGGLRLSAMKPARLRWRQAGVSPGIVRLPNEFSIGVSGMALQARLEEMAYEAQLEPGQFKLSFAARPQPIDVELRARPIKVKGRWVRNVGHHSEVDFGFNRLHLPTYGITASDLRGREVFSPSKGREHLTLSIAEVRSSRLPPLFGAFSLDAAIDHSGTEIKAEAKGRTLAGRALLDIKAVHSRLTQAGSASISLDPPLEGTELFALNTVLPAAGDLTLSRGRVAGAVDISWSDDAFQGRARLGLVDVSLASGHASVRNLNGDINLDSLFPLRTAVEQRLTAEWIEVGRKLRNLDLRFLIAPADPDGAVKLSILQATVASVFGPLAIETGTVIPERRFFDLPVRVSDLDLEALSAWASIEGLAVTGAMSGVIPLRIEDGKLSIRDAALANTVKGRIAFTSDLAARALAAGGEPVDLMLRALESFEYDELEIMAETIEDEDTIELMISTLGNNPDVLEGHPFRFNIRLSGNVPQMLDALSQGGEVAGGILSRMWRLRQ